MYNLPIFKPTVLLLEDEKTQRHLLKTQLEKQGYKVFVEENGKDGIARWEKEQRDIRIVITDLEMPLVDGFKVIETIRAQERLYTYIMVITTMGDKESLVKGLSYGADDYVTKPLITEELSLRLQGAERLLRLQDHNYLVGGLAELAAERGGESGGHLQRTKAYCHLLATKLLQHEENRVKARQFADDMASMSVLHDIGKNGIPDGLLNKRGQYTPKEYEIVKDHTTIGGEILMKLYQQTGSSFLLLGHEIALSHHERWDGDGYPHGLKGEDIPYSARIMCFVDVYDSLLSRKAYKDPMPLEHVESYLTDEKGKQFDPQVIECYEQNREAFIEIHDAIPEHLSSSW